MKTRMIAGTLVLFVACSPARDQATASAQTSAQLPTATLDQLLAPVALYPDALLAQILMSAQDPPKVAELDKWLKSNATLKGTPLQDAAVKAGFDASFVALALFPQVVAKMAEQIAWTVVLGQSFTKDKTAVFATIQKLRKQAQTVGTLKSNEQQEVETKTTSSGEQVIVIEPTNPQIIYVPQYNTQVVYTQPPVTNTTVIVQEDNDAEVAVAAGLIGFTAGIAIGAAMDNNYYYGPYGMRGGFYMYGGAYNDWYDHREDAREDWMDHREDLYEERGEQRRDYAEERTERRSNTAEQRTERTETRRESGTASQAQRTERQQTRNTTAQTRSTATASNTTRTNAGGTRQATSVDRSGTRSDAFSGYSSGKSERAASARGSASRQRSGGGGGRRR